MPRAGTAEFDGAAMCRLRPGAPSRIRFSIRADNNYNVAGKRIERDDVLDQSLNGNDGPRQSDESFFQMARRSNYAVRRDQRAGLGDRLSKPGRNPASSRTENVHGPTLITNGITSVNGQIGSGAVAATNAALGGRAPSTVTVLPAAVSSGYNGTDRQQDHRRAWQSR